MKWGEFKKQAEEAGITDDMEIAYIDVDSNREFMGTDFYRPDQVEGLFKGVVIKN